MQEPTSPERVLTNALRALAEHDARDGASAGVQARLLSEVRALAQARRRTQMKLYAIAAVLVMAVTLPVWQLTRRPSDDAPLSQSSDQGSEAVTEFYPLTFSNVPVTGGQLVRLEVSRVALASFGLPPADSPSSRPGTVLADVLIGEDGLARAVRFVRLGSTSAPQELPQ
jgi:hypothetical protein